MEQSSILVIGLLFIVYGLAGFCYILYRRKEKLKTKFDVVHAIGALISCVILGLQFLLGD